MTGSYLASYFTNKTYERNKTTMEEKRLNITYFKTGKIRSTKDKGFSMN